MHKLIPVLVLIAIGAIAAPLPVMAQLRTAAALPGLSSSGMFGPDHAILLVGGTGGGGMAGGGTTGGGMAGGGMTGGGMTGGGMGGMTGGGMGGMTGAPGGMGGGATGGSVGSYGGTPPYGGATGYSGVQPYGGSETSGEGAQSSQHYRCVAEHGQCSVASTGSLRHGSTCSCLLGGQGKIQ
jgi:hypothetical protein